MKPARSPLLAVTGVFAIAFGLLTLKEGGAVLLVDGEARRAAGHYVPFVLWFNVAAAFGYLAAGLALLRRHPRAPQLAAALSAATAAVLALFGAHVLLGGAWEKRTLVALLLRSLIWAAIAMIGRRALRGGEAARESGPAAA